MNYLHDADYGVGEEEVLSCARMKYDARLEWGQM